MSITRASFLADTTGRRFGDVVKDSSVPFDLLINFFNRRDIRNRMRDSELHHDRPAFAGVVREFEHQDEVGRFLGGTDGHFTRRLRQAVGVLVRLAMEDMGWKTSGHKGSLGRRAPVPPRTTRPGAYVNSSGLARWFTLSERYVPDNPADQEVWDGLQWD